MSYAPPPFQPVARKGKNPIVIVLIILGAIVLLCFGGMALFAWWGINAVNNTFLPYGMCEVNLEAVQKGLRDYAVDHGNKLPSAAKWQEELKPYVAKHMDELSEASKDTGPIRIPVMDLNKAWGCDRGDQKMSGFAFNSELSGVSVDKIPNRDTTPIVFEIPTPTMNANQKYERLDPKTSGKIFNETRGWGIITWSKAYFDGSTMDSSGSSAGSSSGAGFN